MKYPALIIVFLCSILVHGSVYSQWTKLNSGTSQDLLTIHFIDTTNGFCAGGDNSHPGDGIILMTTDGGANWSAAYEDSITVFQEITSNKDTILVAGTGKYGQQIIVYSNDRGNNWRKDTLSHFISNTKYINDKLFYINATTEDLEADNAGTSQKLISRVIRYTGDNNNLYALCWSSTSGYDFVFAKSTDWGASWDTSLLNFAYITSNSISGSSLWTFGDTIVYLATYPSAVAYSYDKGDTWHDTIAQFETWDAYMTSAKVMTSGGFAKKITKTVNGGKSHVVQDSTTEMVKNLFFLDEQRGFLCGKNGIIYKTTNGGAPSSVRQLKNTGTKISIYPNPAGSYLNITSTVRLENAQLCIYNSAGQMVSLTEHLNGNAAHIELDVAMGIYLCLLQQQDRVISSQRLTIVSK